MPTEHIIVFWTQFCACLLAVSCLVRWYLLPVLDTLHPFKQLELLMLPFLIRFVGTSTLVEGVVGPEYSPQIARVASTMDPMNFALALTALVMLRARSRWSFPVLVLFLLQVVVFHALMVWPGPTAWIHDLGAHWYVGTIVVPILTVFQVLVFLRLIKHHRVLRLREAAPST